MSRKQKERTHVRCAMRQVRAFLKLQGISPFGKKEKELIETFARFCELEITGNHKIWLCELWASQGNDHVFKAKSSFYTSDPWLKLRKVVLKKYTRNCMKCGSIKVPSVDHIKPRSTHPELELDINNLQVLCRSCNSKKSNKSHADYRKS